MHIRSKPKKSEEKLSSDETSKFIANELKLSIASSLNEMSADIKGLLGDIIGLRFACTA